MPWRTFTAEQRRAAFLVDRHVLASAGAGSGKTTVMAVRYVTCLIQERILPERILALAFTIEAAGNLRSRIDRTLRQVLRAGCFPRPGNDDEALLLTAEEVTHLRRCLTELPSAPITTVDGACLAWVREGAALLGRDPETGPAEAVAWASLRSRAWARLRHMAVADLAPLISRHGEHQVRTGLLAKIDQASALPSGLATTFSGDPVAVLLQRRSLQLAALPAALAAAGLAPLPESRSGLLELLPELDDRKASGKLKEQIRAVQDLIDYPAPRKADGGRPVQDLRRSRGSLLTLTKWDPALESDLAEDSQRVVRLVAHLLQLIAEESAASGVEQAPPIQPPPDAWRRAIAMCCSTKRRISTGYRRAWSRRFYPLSREYPLLREPRHRNHQPSTPARACSPSVTTGKAFSVFDTPRRRSSPIGNLRCPPAVARWRRCVKISAVILGWCWGSPRSSLIRHSGRRIFCLAGQQTAQRFSPRGR